MTSINTNYGALVALQSLNQTNRELSQVQNRVNTGLKVSSAADNGAVFAIAEGQRARVLSISAVQDGIDRATSVINVGLSAGEAIGDILKQLKEKAVAAQASDLSQDQRDALNADFSALRNQINQIANAATFNGSNVVNGANLSGTGNAFSVVTSDQGGGTGGSTTAGHFQRTTAISAATIAATTDVTTADVGTGGGQGFEAGDTISVTFGSEATSYVFTFAGSETLGDVLSGINTATQGRLTATFDAATSEITYNSSEAFSITIDDADTTDDLDADVRNLFIATTATTAGTGTAASSAYVAGGGYQASGSALSSPVSLLATLNEANSVATSGEYLTIVTGGAGAVGAGNDDSTYQIQLTGATTIQDFLAQVSTETNGNVTAHYNEDTGQITYQSQQAFTVDHSAARTFLEGASTGGLTAELVPTANGSSSGSGANSLAVAGFDFRLGISGQALSGITSTLDISNVSGASSATTAIDSAITSLNKNLATLGAQAKALDVQKQFLGKLTDSIEAGIGNLVDADLAKESARLQALQVKQQLGAQALSIANSAPSIVLSFFR